MRVLAALALALALAATPASAQPAPRTCASCTAGDAIIDRYGVGDVRPLATTLASLRLVEPLSPEQYAQVVDLRAKTPSLVRLGAIDDAELAQIAAALCRTPQDACTEATTRALRCLADRCAVALPQDRANVDIATERCDRYTTRKRSAPVGLGFDWGNGYHRSKHPHDGHAWSLGIEARARVTSRLGAVARVDRVAGRDASEDENADGLDDQSTGSITRVAALAGPSFVLDFTTFERTTRFLRLDVLAGYVATRSQPDEDGPAVGFDLGYQLWSFRTGVRVVQGMFDASETTTVLAHLGFVVGSTPQYTYGVNCDRETTERSSRLAMGFDFPTGGYGLASLGYLDAGIGFDMKWFLTRRLDAIARADLMLFSGDERERVIHQAVLAGLRLDHGKDSERSSRTGFFTTLLGGYSHSAGFTPTTTGSGPIVDASLGWGIQSREGAAWMRVHGRFGLSPDNVDYRVFFLSGGFELRFDPRRWKRRV